MRRSSLAKAQARRELSAIADLAEANHELQVVMLRWLDLGYEIQFGNLSETCELLVLWHSVGQLLYELLGDKGSAMLHCIEMNRLELDGSNSKVMRLLAVFSYAAFEAHCPSEVLRTLALIACESNKAHPFELSHVREVIKEYLRASQDERVCNAERDAILNIFKCVARGIEGAHYCQRRELLEIVSPEEQLPNAAQGGGF